MMRMQLVNLLDLSMTNILTSFYKGHLARPGMTSEMLRKL